MTDQANDQTELDTLREHVWEAGREIKSAHLLLSRVSNDERFQHAPEHFKKAVADALDVLEELYVLEEFWKLEGAHILFKDEEEE